MPNSRQSMMAGISGGIVLIGIALAFAFGGGFNLTVFFLALAVASLISALGSNNSGRLYGGFIGFIWLLMLALFFATHSWLWFLVGAGLSAILRPLVISFMGGAGLSNMRPPQAQRPPVPYYQPPANQPNQRPEGQAYQSYQEGYRPPASQPETYQEGGQQHPYPPTPQQPYEQPQAQYPQQMPPPQQ